MDYSKKELERIQIEKEDAIRRGNFEKAAKLRDEEKRLIEVVGSIPGKSPKIDISKQDMVKNAIKVFLLIALLDGYFLYKLFVKKVMCGRGTGEVGISGNDPLFWIYAAILIVPVVVSILLMCTTFVNRKTKNDG